MELKDVILSTLAEMESADSLNSEPKLLKKEQKIKSKKQQSTIVKTTTNDTKESAVKGEIMFLTSMRERLLVLFEGFQAPNNTNIEAKIEMTLNFLEYILANIDNRVEELRK